MNTGSPDPKNAVDWRQWAEEFLRYLDETEGREGEVLPAPILLQHQDAAVLARAVTDGLMMFDPTAGVAGAPVVSVGGVWKTVTIT